MDSYIFDLHDLGNPEVENINYWQMVRKISRHCRRFDIKPQDYMAELLNDVEFEIEDCNFLKEEK